MSDNKTSRREFIKYSALTAAAATAAVSIAGVALPREVDMPVPYPTGQPSEMRIPVYNQNVRFFDAHQYRLVATIAALIVPSDDTPGATEAGVVDTIDRMLADDPERQIVYRKGLRWIDTVSAKRFGAGNDFLQLETEDQVALLCSIDRSNLIHRRSGKTVFEKIDIKLGIFWDMVFGFGRNARFFYEIHRDIITAFYSNDVSWRGIGYFGPPQPEGYLDFMDPPSSDNYTGRVRPIRSETCKTCHQDVKHPTGALIDHSCRHCHHPHRPWPATPDSFHLEDYIGFVFPSPDRKLGNQ